MRNPDIIPPKDGDFNVFQKNVMTAMIANRLRWNIPLQEITEAQALQVVWETRWGVSKADRTSSMTIMKQLARKEYMKKLRLMIKRFIRHNSAVTDSDLTVMGIKPLAKHKTRVQKPTMIPVIEAMPLSVHNVKVHIRQSLAEGGHKRAKPKGVGFCEIVYSITDTPPYPEECTRRK